MTVQTLSKQCGCNIERNGDPACDLAERATKSRGDGMDAPSGASEQRVTSFKDSVGLEREVSRPRVEGRSHYSLLVRARLKEAG